MVRAARSHEMLSRSETESSAEVRQRVAMARRIQAKRFVRGKLRLRTNADLTGEERIATNHLAEAIHYRGTSSMVG